MTTGLTLRHEGQAASLAGDTAPHRQFARYIEDAIDHLAGIRGGEFTADVVRELASAEARKDGVNLALAAPNLLPSLMGIAAREGRIVRLPRDVNSTRRTRHASRIGTYTGATP